MTNVAGSVYMTPWSVVIQNSLGQFGQGNQMYFGGYYNGANIYDGLTYLCVPDPTGQNTRNYILQMQKVLNGWLRANVLTIGGPISEDGIYGSGTMSRVAAYQKWRGLAADGLCGQTTWSALTGTTISI
ncbi:MAG: peptidoglycan-binding protein [Propionibacteriaceae bacterium]|jgi:peptidoglycan hydrolase-like protein with peptidoglycan-binding domain|nr:peptidoglycan-binding protein [Propionibacteriaceae bacterium]